MKVLVATNRTQGAVTGDYCWTVEGELVLGGPMLECCDADECGCARGFPGLASSRATTTAIIEDRPDLDRRLLATAIRESLDRQGWLAGLGPDLIDECLADEVALIEEIAGAFAAGTVIGRHGTEVHARRAVAA
ncbi:hypothetical protein BH24ACT5_BH24ACT5_07320 [soil metagenome]